MSDIGQRIIAEVRQLASENYAFVYPYFNCVYREGGPASTLQGGPASCLMGRALDNLGLLPDDTAGLEAKGIAKVLDILQISVDDSERAWLIAAQMAQDGRRPSPAVFERELGRASWGRAVGIADESVPL